ncbi:MAG: transporter permease [Solirubrobacterales bacterium]|jgi:ABC-2 type transport system permease protein|nr:transporter permease [Solirubrobacterales bacterium]
MNALLHAELLKLRTTRTFAVVVGTAAALSVVLVALGAILGEETDPHALFTNNSITYIIVLLGAIGMTGEWRHRTITGTVLAAPDRLRLLAAKALSYSLAGVVLSLLVTAATMLVGTLVLDARGEATLGAGGLADVLWRNLVVAALLGPLGVCVGALVRNQIVTVVGLVAMAAVLEPAVTQVAPEVGRFGPIAGTPDGILGIADVEGLLAPGLALVVLTAWAGVAFAAAAWRLRSHDLV